LEAARLRLGAGEEGPHERTCSSIKERHLPGRAPGDLLDHPATTLGEALAELEIHFEAESQDPL
jgi:hypothetical protein